MARYIPRTETQEHKTARLVKARAAITPEGIQRRTAHRLANQGPEVIAAHAAMMRAAQAAKRLARLAAEQAEQENVREVS